MHWEDIRDEVCAAYIEIASNELFTRDEVYLKEAFYGIEKLWDSNFQRITEVRFVLFSEAPLWQDKMNYFYYPTARLTQFIYKNDFAIPLRREILDKEELLNVMGDIGFVVLDCSPLALAEGFTSITYNSLSSKQYSMLMKRMIQTFLKLKLQTVLEKAYQPPKFLFRYKRVQEALELHIHQLLSSMNYQDSNFECIGQQGGGIDRAKLTSILN